MIENKERLACYTSQLQQTDSLTIVTYVSFTVTKNGKIEKAKVEKTECTEYDIEELDKKAVRKIEKEALRVIKEMDNLDPIEKPTRYTQPIKMKLPTNQYLINKKWKQ